MKICIILFLLISDLFANNLEEGISLFKEGKYVQAKQVFEMLVDKNGNAVAYYWLGRALFSLKKYEEAMDKFEEARDLDNKVADYYFWYGNVIAQEIQTANIFIQALMVSDLKEAFEKTVKLDPNHVGGHLGLAQFYLNVPSIAGGDIDKAKSEAHILLKLDSKNGILILARIYEKEENYPEAEKQYDKFHKNFDIAVDNPVFYNSYGYFLLKINKADKAIDMFKRQVKLRPNSANSYDSLGDGLRKAGRLKEALASYKKAIEIDPQFEPSKKNIEELESELKE